MNKLIAKGNLATDPGELRTTAGGTHTCSFKMAVNRPPREGREQKTDYFWVKTFGKQAVAVNENLVKGSEVLIDGMIDAGDVKQADGSYKSYFEVAARTVEFLRRPKSQTEAAAVAEDEVPVETDEPVEPSSSDIPF